MRSTVMAVAIRLVISASPMVSGAIHAYLYVNGDRDIPTIGPAFLEQAIVSASPMRRSRRHYESSCPLKPRAPADLAIRGRECKARSRANRKAKTCPSSRTP
jgi:hypothetical protein